MPVANMQVKLYDISNKFTNDCAATLFSDQMVRRIKRRFYHACI